MKTRWPRVELAVARRDHAHAHRGRRLGPVAPHVVGARPVDAHDQVEAIEERSREPPPVGLDPLTRARAAVGPAARARVHRGHELRVGGQAGSPPDPRDRHLAILERLAQGLEGVAGELGELVQKQHAA